VISVKVLAIAGVVSFGFVVASVAGPLDSPGTVYIDGTPCNLSCQSYMAWSRQILNANQAGTKGATKTAATKTLRERTGKRISKRVEPATANAPSRKSEDIQVTLSSTPEPLPKSEIEVTPRNAEVREPPALTSPSLEPRAVAKSETENASVSAGTSDSPRERTPQQLVMAALAVVEKITNAETPQGQGSEPTDGNKAGDPNISRPRIALLISRPDLKSASALKGLNVAIDAAQSAAEQDIRSALAAVGATETQILVSDVSPLDRLISGDVQAAVVKLVSADAAEAFPDIKGFKVLRVPLSPR
jgi:hypothetical protein